MKPLSPKPPGRLGGIGAGVMVAEARLRAPRSTSGAALPDTLMPASPLVELLFCDSRPDALALLVLVNGARLIRSSTATPNTPNSEGPPGEAAAPDSAKDDPLRFQ